MTPNTPFYVTRPLTAKALSSPVGSGKSYAAAQFLARADQARRNWVYVAPTIALVEQVTVDLRKAAATAGNVTRNVALIHSENRQAAREEDDDSDPGDGTTTTRAAALRALNGAELDDGLVVVLTTGTLLAIISSITHPERFGLILDEAFKPLRVDGWAMGDSVAKVIDNWRFFRELFDVDVADGHRIVPAPGQRETVEAIAAGSYRSTGAKFAGLQRVAELVANKATRCELVKSAQVDALMAGRDPTIRKSTGKDKAKDAAVMLTYAGYVSPEPFGLFREALFLSALFEDTILYHLWTRALGVIFLEHEAFPKHLQRDVHAEQGRFLSVGHMLHEKDTASIENLHRDAHTGTREAPQGRRVLDRLVTESGNYFADKGRYLLQVNAKKGYGTTPGIGTGSKLAIPGGATLIPAFAHGRNNWQDVDHVAAFCVINPTPIERAWVMERTGMTGPEVGRAYRIHSVYQALGRCSIRRRDADRETLPKTLLCVGRDEADFVLRLFPGSRAIGQVIDLPCLRELEASNKAPKVKPRTATEELAGAIRRHLENIYSGTDRVTSEAIKSAILADSGSCIASPPNSLRKDECASWSTLHRNTWSAAFELACEDSGWRKAGRWLERRESWESVFPGHQAESTASVQPVSASVH